MYKDELFILNTCIAWTDNASNENKFGKLFVLNVFFLKKND